VIAVLLLTVPVLLFVTWRKLIRPAFVARHEPPCRPWCVDASEWTIDPLERPRASESMPAPRDGGSLEAPSIGEAAAVVRAGYALMVRAGFARTLDDIKGLPEIQVEELLS